MSRRGENWSEVQLAEALKAVEGGGISVRKASTHFGIPRRTLRNHIGSKSAQKRLGRKSVLSAESEKELVDRIIRFADIGFPLTAKTIRSYVFEYVEAMGIQHPFVGAAGRKWFRLFMKRWPQLSFRKAQPMNPARAQKLNKFIVNDFYKKLEDALNELNILDRPDRIFNIDEKGCRLSLHHQQSVIAAKGRKRVHLVAPEHGENVTIVACANALGTPVPPMIIFKGKYKKDAFGDDLPPLSRFEMSEKGCMTNELFVKFLNHFGRFKPPGKVLLILDGAKSHLSPSIVDEASKFDITLFCLPANTTHELQPLDVAVFRSFEHYWDEEVQKFWRQRPDRALTKDLFGKIFTPTWNKALSITNIQNGFRKCGIYPLDQDALPDHAFAPSEVTRLPDVTPTVASESNQTDTIPQSSTMEYPSTDQQLPTTSKEAVLPGTSRDEMVNKVSFTSIISTPPKKVKKDDDRALRRKSINYRATVVEKSLFSADRVSNLKRKKENPSDQKKKKKQKISTVTQKENVADEWYCSICGEYSVQDMRSCGNCQVWYHEECVGLTKDDDEFLCPDCEISNLNS